MGSHAQVRSGPPWLPRSGYLFAPLVSGAVLVTMNFAGGPQAANFLFLPVLGVAATALLYGSGPGLVAALLSVVACDWLFFPPIGSLTVEDGFEAWRLGGLGAVTALLAWASGSARAAYRALARQNEEVRLANSRLEQQRVQTERAVRQRDEVLAVVSHDLRNPLASVAAGADRLKRAGAADPEAMVRVASNILTATARMDRLIGDLLDATRLDAGQLAIEFDDVPAAALARQAFEEAEELAAARSIALEYDVGEGVPDVRCDRHRILQVLGNLVGNAVKATAPGGRVGIRVEMGAGGVRFTVEDNGPGIPAADLPHVFERFRRGRTASYDGSGLGLSIAKGLVEAHGGRIAMDSTPSVGTTAWFTIPVSTDSPSR